MRFPADFIWGSASSAAQIEGGYLDDGRTPSVWDNMPKGKVNKDEDCHTACDHYHRWREDVALMKQIGLKAYRFSISWSRVTPAKGCINPNGLAFYRDLTDALLDAGIQPMITLFHADMPQWVYDQGGWLSDDTPKDFAFFAKTMSDALSDRVTYWFTMNEPQCFFSDFLEMVNMQERDIAAKQVYRNILLSHGLAVKALRSGAMRPLKIGMVIMGLAVEPVPGALDENQAMHMMFSDLGGYMGMARWLDPIMDGTCPNAVSDILTPCDLALIHQKLDIFCCNVYGSANYYDNPGRKNPLSFPGIPKSHIGMPIRPKCLYYMAKFAYQKYGLPILFTENGFSNIDFVMLDGKVHDPQRIDYMHSYLLSAQQAIQEGIPVLGYLYWSIMDNFEWAKGYDLRFGLIYVDYRTQERILKDSAYFYQSIIESNGEILFQ